MIGLDTNILLRAFVNDDPVQSSAARRFLDRRDDAAPKFVCLVVLVEFAWSLRRTYGYPRGAVLEAVRRLLDANDTVVQCRDLVASCVSVGASVNSELSDLLIGKGNLAEGCTTTVTFDRIAARRIPGMELLT